MAQAAELVGRKWLKTPEVCELLGVGRKFVYQLVEQGQFPSAVKMSNRMGHMIPQDELEDYLSRKRLTNGLVQALDHPS